MWGLRGLLLGWGLRRPLLGGVGGAGGWGKGEDGSPSRLHAPRARRRPKPYPNPSRQGINQLGENAKSGALEDAKRSFVTSVSALQSWAETAGIAGELKGL